MKLGLFLSACLAASIFAQDAKFYRLDFSVKELDDNKVVSVKKYSTFIGNDESASIRTGNKVPIQTSAGNYQYYDIGVNIDCKRIREVNGQLAVSVVAEISSIPVPEGPAIQQPMIRQNRWAAAVSVEPGKPSTLFSSDDMNSKRKVQLELIATPMK
jgi:hypothetical protein